MSEEYEKKEVTSIDDMPPSVRRRLKIKNPWYVNVFGCIVLCGLVSLIIPIYITIPFFTALLIYGFVSERNFKNFDDKDDD